MPNIEKFKKLTLGGLADRHGTPITNEEGVRYLLIEPERRKVIGVDTTINGTFIIIISFIKSIDIELCLLIFLINDHFSLTK